MDTKEKIFTSIILTEVWTCIVLFVLIKGFRINNIMLSIACLIIYLIFYAVKTSKERTKENIKQKNESSKDLI